MLCPASITSSHISCSRQHASVSINLPRSPGLVATLPLPHHFVPAGRKHPVARYAQPVPIPSRSFMLLLALPRQSRLHSPLTWEYQVHSLRRCLSYVVAGGPIVVSIVDHPCVNAEKEAEREDRRSQAEHGATAAMHHKREDGTRGPRCLKEARIFGEDDDGGNGSFRRCSRNKNPRPDGSSGLYEKAPSPRSTQFRRI